MFPARPALALTLSAAVAPPLADPAFAANGEAIGRLENRANRCENRRDEAVGTGVPDVWRAIWTAPKTAAITVTGERRR